MLEFYLNDILIECFSLPTAANGGIGLIDNVSNFKAWELPKPKVVKEKT
ncbi:MAG: hypothetical protein ACYSW4_07850 [Planctomycetota bacterium]|jgi:hypothetical protein